MGFHMVDWCAEFIGDLREAFELTTHDIADGARRKIHRAAAHVFAILVAGVSANRDAVLECEADRCTHRRVIAGMATACDVCRADQWHDHGIMRAAFAEVAVEIDALHVDHFKSSNPVRRNFMSRSSSSHALRASSSVTSRNRSGAPMLARASLGRSAEITCPICG